MENNSNISIELEEMRLQMAALQKQLDERLKLNEQQLQKNTMKKINAINKYGYYNLLELVAAIIGLSIVQYRFHISFEFMAFALISQSLYGLFNFWLANRIRKIDLSQKSVKELISKLISMKKTYQRTFYYDIFVSFFIFVPWIIYEIYVHSLSHFMFAEGFPTTLFICTNTIIFLSIMTIAIIFSKKMFNKQQRNISELIEMIKDKD